MQLLNKEQELKITEASTVGDVRIVDPAITQPGGAKTEERADYPWGDYSWPDVVDCRRNCCALPFNRGIESPQVLEEHGINVYASIPLSEWQKSCGDSVKKPSTA